MKTFKTILTTVIVTVMVVLGGGYAILTYLDVDQIEIQEVKSYGTLKTELETLEEEYANLDKEHSELEQNVLKMKSGEKAYKIEVDVDGTHHVWSKTGEKMFESEKHHSFSTLGVEEL